MGFAAPLRHDLRKAVRHCRTAFLFVDLRACRPVYIAVSVMVLPRPAVHVAALVLPAGGCRHPISCLLAVVYGRGSPQQAYGCKRCRQALGPTVLRLASRRGMSRIVVLHSRHHPAIMWLAAFMHNPQPYCLK